MTIDFSKCVTVDDYHQAILNRVAPSLAVSEEKPLMWDAAFGESRLTRESCHQCFYLVRCKTWKDLANPCGAFSVDEKR